MSLLLIALLEYEYWREFCGPLEEQQPLLVQQLLTQDSI